MSTIASTTETEAQPDEESGAELASKVEQLADDDAVPEAVGEVLSTLLERDERSRERIDQLEERNRQLEERNRQLCERVEDLRQDVERLEDAREHTHDVATSAVGTAQANEHRLDDVEEAREKTREISKCALATAQQLDAKVQDDRIQEDDEQVPHGIATSTSPLDFFANCRQEKVREMYVENSNRPNTYRAVCVARRWDEFANRTNDGERVFWKREDIETALTAHLGESPYSETVSRVWDILVDIGGEDLEERTRQVSRSQEPYKIIEMDLETARGLDENRYLGLDLLEESIQAATTGGVTPVVIEGSG